MIGTLLGERYRVTARIARGGMADVFSATDEKLERTVAVKLLRGADDSDPGAFLDELHAQGKVNHPSVVQLYDAGTFGDQTYLVMEYVRGRSLRDVAAAGPLDQREAATIGACVAEALAAAHTAEIVHRDVKPANILVDGDGQVRLADFGIARLADPARVVRRGMTYGTAAYLSPEQVRGQRAGPAADVYALGLVLLEALTGEREFTGPPLEAAVARLSRDPHVPADLPPAWAVLLRAMTARDPADRPPAQAAAARLRQLERPQPVQAAPAPARPRAWAHAALALIATLLLVTALLVVAARAGGG